MDNRNRNRYSASPASASSARRAKRARERKIRRIATCVIAVLIVALIVFLVVKLCIGKGKTDAAGKGNKANTSQSAGESESKNKGDPNEVVATADVLSTGDILIHSMILDYSKQADGSYEFNQDFTMVKDAVSKADLAVANFEITLGGPDKAYSGFPCFNTPDSILDALKNAGFDFLVTANNHCYDTSFAGLKRTAKTIRDYGFGQAGTRADLSQKKYEVVDVNGIKLGMVNYTYETTSDQPDRKGMNGILMTAEAGDYVNSFREDKLSDFYKEMEQNIKDMKKDGAEAVILYIHWGVEYSTQENEVQKKIAQKMCDLGVDVIVGGHPHVLQPAETLTSEVSGKQTFCIYSVGNAISNQRTAYMTGACSTGHTEDGILVYTKFTKYGDGHVELTGVDYTPTWVNRYQKNGQMLYEVTPLDDLSKVTTNADQAAKSKERTEKIVDAGFKSFKPASASKN